MPPFLLPPHQPPPHSGQDLPSIEQYVLSQYNASLHDNSTWHHADAGLAPPPLASFVPAAAMVYTDLETLRGLSRPADYGSGIEYADGILDNLFAGYSDGDVGLQIGLWLGGSSGCRKINAGDWDDRIEDLIDYLSGCSAAKVFLRIGYEFDNPWFGYSDKPAEYVRAFRRVVTAIRKSPCKSKVLSVWHSWAAPKVQPLQSFWPGEQYVDWVGVSIFQQLYPWANDDAHGGVDSDWAGGTLADVEEVLRFAASHGNKPTMIAESTPFGGIDMVSNETREYDLSDPWERWYAPTLELIDKWDVKMWSYIDCDWESQPMWHGVGFGESRVSSNDRVMEMWRDVVVNGGRTTSSRRSSASGGRKFLMAGSMKHCGKGRSSSGESLLGLGRVFDSQEGFLISSRMDGRSRSLLGGAAPLLFCALLGLVIASFVSATWRSGTIPSSRGGDDEEGEGEAAEATPINAK